MNKLDPNQYHFFLSYSRSGKDQAELSREIAKYLKRHEDRSLVNKIIKGRRRVQVDELMALEAITGIPSPTSAPHVSIPLLDSVPAGRLSEPVSQIIDVPTVSLADLGPGKFFALTVKGDSMDRISPEGSIILVDQADKHLVGGKYYVFSVRGETTYKRWHADPAYLEPFSWSPSHHPIFPKRKKDLEVIGRVKRTIMDL